MEADKKWTTLLEKYIGLLRVLDDESSFAEPKSLNQIHLKSSM